MTFTAKRPTRAGWYWLRRSGKPDKILEVGRSELWEFRTDRTYYERAAFAGPFPSERAALDAARPGPPPPPVDPPVPPEPPKPDQPPVIPDVLPGDLFRLQGLHNETRVHVGLPPLDTDPRCSAAAQAQANALARSGVLSHWPEGVGFDTRLRDFGYVANAYGDNIAWNFTEPVSLFAAWMNSPGHRANILGPLYAHLGLGRSGVWWCAAFAAPAGWRPLAAAPAIGTGEIGTAFGPAEST